MSTSGLLHSTMDSPTTSRIFLTNIMKKRIINGLALAAALVPAHGFNISVTNAPSASPAAVPILDNTGTPIAQGSGYVASGTFSSLPTSIAEIRTAFSPFGTPAAGQSTAFGGSPVNGLFDSTRGLTLRPPLDAGQTAIVGQAIYVVFGNGADLASSTQFAVFDGQEVIGQDAENLAAPESEVSVQITDTTLTPERLLFGDLVTGVAAADSGLPIDFNEGIRLSDGATPPIPEPSTSLLAALAGLALAARRRR